MRMTFGLIGVLLSACATPEPKEPPLEGTFTLSSAACLGLCPVFTMQITPDDRYRLNSGANTINPGRSTGGLPVGSFRKALDLLKKYDFQGLQDTYTVNNSAACSERVTGTPILEIGRQTAEFNKRVTYDVGCLGFAEKDRMDQLIVSLYETLRINDLVAVGEPPTETVDDNAAN